MDQCLDPSVPTRLALPERKSKKPSELVMRGSIEGNKCLAHVAMKQAKERARMFFRRNKSTPALAKENQHFTAKTWDDETVLWLMAQKRLDVSITQITKSNGQGRSTTFALEKSEYDVSGLILHPKYIAVRIEFTSEAPDERGIGITMAGSHKCSQDILENGALRRKEVSVPVLTFSIGDPQHKTSEMLREAMRDALLSNQTHCHLRIWKNENETWDQNEPDAWRRLPILGCYGWATLRSPRLPDWAMPVFSAGFCLDHLPDYPSQFQSRE
jgi:hypothetical protein